MHSLQDSSIECIASYLDRQERFNLAISSKSLYGLIKATLIPEYDKKIKYGSLRRTFLRAIQFNNKKKARLTTIHKDNKDFLVVKQQIYNFPKELFSVHYTFNSSDAISGTKTFINDFNDEISIANPLIYNEEGKEINPISWLSSSDEFNAIDFTDKNALLKRQQDILQKIKNNELTHELKIDDNSLKFLRNQGNIVIILCLGGSFSIANFDENGKCTFHKSDKKYVVRGKQGQRQSTADKTKGGIRSIGSQIRRANEQKHKENIIEIIEENTQILDDANAIFFFAPGVNRNIFLSEEGVLQRWQNKIKSVGSSIQRAKFEEAKRIFEEMTTVTFLFNV
mmetsp:Transcript_7471/g.7344  ORF Transcript_7471/g.7344 Transcript_7471/m.7344 type:complete len:339 (+) Transcript_7471:3-1019(+)